MSTLKPISRQEIDSLKHAGLNHKKSEILCRMGIFSYLKTTSDIKKAIGDEWFNLETWLDENNENQGFAAWSEGVAIISFRGSNKDWGDWSKNADAFFPDRHPIGGRRHNGFHDVWTQSAGLISNILNNKIGENSILWITGHSLGGAVATAASAELILNKPNKITDYYVMTFGAPRYGNRQFQQTYDQQMGDKHWFYVNQRDPVPHLGPNWMGYRHAGLLKFFSNTGELLQVSKQDVGLQSLENDAIGEAKNQWYMLDEEIKRHSNSRDQLESLVREMMEQASEINIEFKEEGVLVDDMEGALQGDSFWTTSSHDSALYWKRINSIALQG